MLQEVVGGPSLGQKRGTKQLVGSPIRLTIENWVASAWRHSDPEESHKTTIPFIGRFWIGFGHGVWGVDTVFVQHGLGGVGEAATTCS